MSEVSDSTKKECKFSYEMLRVGDLVQYNDPIPEDMMAYDVPGIVTEVTGLNYMKVKWLGRDIKPGIHLRRELKLLSRASGPEKIPKK